MPRSHRCKTLADSSLLNLLVFAIDVLLRTASADCIWLLDDEEGWVAAVIIINVLETSVGCKNTLVNPLEQPLLVYGPVSG
jgi:hypothetical protein